MTEKVSIRYVVFGWQCSHLVRRQNIPRTRAFSVRRNRCRKMGKDSGLASVTAVSGRDFDVNSQSSLTAFNAGVDSSTQVSVPVVLSFNILATSDPQPPRFTANASEWITRKTWQPQCVSSIPALPPTFVQAGRQWFAGHNTSLTKTQHRAINARDEWTFILKR